MGKNLVLDYKAQYRRRDVETALSCEVESVQQSLDGTLNLPIQTVIEAYAMVRQLAKKEGIDTEKYDSLVEKITNESGMVGLEIKGDRVRIWNRI